MAVDFAIPKLGDNVTEATVINWLVDDGAEVNEGDDILEVETDKAVVPIPANASGVLKIGSVSAGDVVQIDQVVASIEGSGENGESGKPEASSESAAESSTAAAPAEKQKAAAPQTASAATESARRVTPVAQKIAAEKGIDLSAINGSGYEGRVTKADVLNLTEEKAPAAEAKPKPAPQAKPQTQPKAAPPQPQSAPPPPQPAAQQPPTPEEEVLERKPLKGIRGVIARRMAESVQTTARVTLITEVDATEFVNLRGQLKSRYAEDWGFSPGYNDLLAMIVASGLRQFPYMNARLSANGESIEHLKPVNMGMAVDTERGLLVTVLRDADRKGLKEIGSGFRDLVKKARSGKANMDELSGSTFTISSLGTFRVDAFTPVINLPETAILGVGRIKEKPVVKEGEIVVRQMLTLSLVFDHRLTDGAPAARFLDYICELIEEPYLLFLTRK